MFSSLEASPPTVHFNSTSTSKTFDIEDLDAETENEEAVAEDGMTRKEAQEMIMRHSLPKALSRKNVELPGYAPEGRLFGGEGITQATYRYPKVAKAIHHLASLRGGEAKSEGYLSAKSKQSQEVACA